MSSKCFYIEFSLPKLKTQNTEKQNKQKTEAKIQLTEKQKSDL